MEPQTFKLQSWLIDDKHYLPTVYRGIGSHIFIIELKARGLFPFDLLRIQDVAVNPPVIIFTDVLDDAVATQDPPPPGSIVREGHRRFIDIDSRIFDDRIGLHQYELIFVSTKGEKTSRFLQYYLEENKSEKPYFIYGTPEVT